MPELPEVESIVRRLRRPLLGRTIAGVRVLWPRTVAQPGLTEFARRPIGLRIRAIRRRAKYLVFELARGGVKRPDAYLLVHLKM